jgi:hypothetical protein
VQVVTFGKDKYDDVKTVDNEVLLQTLKEAFHVLKIHHARRVLEMKANLRAAVDEDLLKKLPECPETSNALKSMLSAEQILYDTLAKLSHFFRDST